MSGPSPASADGLNGPELGQTDGATVLRGGVWGLLVAVVPPLQTLLISIAAARLLGAEDFGRQSFMAFISVSCVSVFAARVPAALSRFGAELFGAGENGMVVGLLRWTVRVQVLSGLAAAVGFTAAAVFGATPSGGWVLAGLATWVACVHAAASSFLVAAQRWRDSLLPGLVTTIAAVIAAISVLALGGGITGYFAVEFAVAAVNLAWTTRYAARLRGQLGETVPITSARRREFRSFMQASTFFAVIEFVVLSRSEVVFLRHYSGATEVALYSVAFAAAAAVGRVPAMVTNVALPAVATLHGAGEHDRIRWGYWRGTRLLIALCPTLVAVAAGLGAALLGLVYGSEYHGAQPVLAILLTPFALLPVTGMASALLWIFGRMRFLVIWGVIGTIADLGLAFLLVPPWGAEGAAVVNVVAQLVVGVPSLVLVGRMLAPAELEPRFMVSSIVLALLAGLATLVPIVLLDGFAEVVAAGAAAAVVLWLATGRLALLSEEDTAWLTEAAGHRIGPLAPLLRRLGGPTRRGAADAVRGG
ncbi:MAG TPA: lipopolysaccharide biosynthesis protein [Baekduia sp.]|uniref:lipopolysaccharide biosynthesis protein n=1 Tax=Baekduia sp. TaxID=2600305 RepID=UPI002D779432|nr:lipopolysaccharide biosynthesis protein [Baekduia sp.]HET6508407.1 lipopolysaccharide biosynthesis protein [Baekduia sp.]